MSGTSNQTGPGSFALSLVRDDLIYRLQRRIGLIPAEGSGMVRRAVFWSLLAWLPIALWAWYNGRALPQAGSEPLLAHFGIHVRFLVAVPLLIFAEAPAQGVGMRLLPYLCGPECCRIRSCRASVPYAPTLPGCAMPRFPGSPSSPWSSPS